MIFDAENFARKYAFRYTGILAILLIVPLVIYIQLLLQIDDAKVKISLDSQAKKIITSMQRYDNQDKVYNFPRYKEYKAALYSGNYNAIFSTLDFEPISFVEGFHQKGNRYYHIHALPPGYYFGADYLLVSTIHSANNIYFLAAMVMIAIIVALFVFSFFLLRNFSAPFENLNRQLDHFIKDSMHEINTPLSIINLNVDLFANKFGENKYLGRIKSASKTLATIYDDMDYLVKEGRVKDNRSMIDFSEFIQGRVEYFQEVSNLKQIALNTNIESDIMYEFSKTKLQRIVDNTISNAIKYSNDNSDIEIDVYTDGPHIIFRVKDNGHGIEDIHKIFSRYYRENESKGGFGIGLNIVKQIIDEENILLSVESIPGEGATFIYTF